MQPIWFTEHTISNLLVVYIYFSIEAIGYDTIDLCGIVRAGSTILGGIIFRSRALRNPYIYILFTALVCRGEDSNQVFGMSSRCRALLHCKLAQSQAPELLYITAPAPTVLRPKLRFILCFNFKWVSEYAISSYVVKILTNLVLFQSSSFRVI